MTNAYDGVDKGNLQSICRQCELLSMTENEGVCDYFTRSHILMKLMKVCGDKFTYQQVIEKILRNLTPQFHVRTLIVPTI